jgi:hypothetical protein
VWHQTKVYIHTENGAYSPEGKGKAESEDCHLPPGNELTTATLKASGGCNDAQNKYPLYYLSLISLFFGIFPSLRDEYLILAIAMEPTYKIITNFVEEIKTVQYARETTADTNLQHLGKVCVNCEVYPLGCGTYKSR